jgi:hypothetical protein
LIADFVAGLDRINAMADGAPGFVWRLQTEDGNATAIRPPEAFTFKCRFAPPDDGSIVAAVERDVCRA